MKTKPASNSKYLVLLPLMLLSIWQYACKKEAVEAEDPNNRELVFEINKIAFDYGDAIKQQYVEGHERIPVKAEIRIDGFWHELYADVLEEEGRYITKGLVLPIGEYRINRFLLLDAEGQIVMATPESGSEMAVHVKAPVKFETTIKREQENQFSIEVLDFYPEVYEKFGFGWFVIVHEVCMFGDLCFTGQPYYPGVLEGSMYEDAEGGLQIDMAAIFKVYAYSGDSLIAGFPYSNEEWLGVGQALCFDYSARPYMPKEPIHLELWILVPDGEGGVFYKHYYTFETNKQGKTLIGNGNDGVIDFVVGSCLHGQADLTLQWLMPGN